MYSFFEALDFKFLLLGILLAIFVGKSVLDARLKKKKLPQQVERLLLLKNTLYAFTLFALSSLLFLPGIGSFTTKPNDLTDVEHPERLLYLLERSHDALERLTTVTHVLIFMFVLFVMGQVLLYIKEESSILLKKEDKVESD